MSLDLDLSRVNEIGELHQSAAELMNRLKDIDARLAEYASLAEATEVCLARHVSSWLTTGNQAEVTQMHSRAESARNVRRTLEGDAGRLRMDLERVVRRLEVLVRSTYGGPAGDAVLAHYGVAAVRPATPPEPPEQPPVDLWAPPVASSSPALPGPAAAAPALPAPPAPPSSMPAAPKASVDFVEWRELDAYSELDCSYSKQDHHRWDIVQVIRRALDRLGGRGRFLNLLVEVQRERPHWNRSKVGATLDRSGVFRRDAALHWHYDPTGAFMSPQAAESRRYRIAVARVIRTGVHYPHDILEALETQGITASSDRLNHAFRTPMFTTLGNQRWKVTGDADPQLPAPPTDIVIPGEARTIHQRDAARARALIKRAIEHLGVSARFPDIFCVVNHWDRRISRSKVRNRLWADACFKSDAARRWSVVDCAPQVVTRRTAQMLWKERVLERVFDDHGSALKRCEIVRLARKRDDTMTAAQVSYLLTHGAQFEPVTGRWGWWSYDPELRAPAEASVAIDPAAEVTLVPLERPPRIDIQRPNVAYTRRLERIALIAQVIADCGGAATRTQLREALNGQLWRGALRRLLTSIPCLEQTRHGWIYLPDVSHRTVLERQRLLRQQQICAIVGRTIDADGGVASRSELFKALRREMGLNAPKDATTMCGFLNWSGMFRSRGYGQPGWVRTDRTAL